MHFLNNYIANVRSWIQKVILSESNRIKHDLLLHVVIISCNLLSINPFLIARRSRARLGYQFHPALDTLCQKLNFEIKAISFISFENLSKIVKSVSKFKRVYHRSFFAKEKRRTFSAIKSEEKKKRHTHINNCSRLIINVEPNLKIESHALKKITLKLHNIQSSYKKYRSKSISENWIS